MNVWNKKYVGICLLILLFIIMTVAAVFLGQKYISSDVRVEGKVDDVEIDYGNSNNYSDMEMDAAIDKIYSTFKEFSGCTLYTISYVDDDTSNKYLEYCNRNRSSEEHYDECIYFNSHFHTSKKVNLPWQKDTDYFWCWILARKEGGEWELVSYGFDRS